MLQLDPGLVREGIGPPCNLRIRRHLTHRNTRGGGSERLQAGKLLGGLVAPGAFRRDLEAQTRRLLGNGGQGVPIAVGVEAVTLRVVADVQVNRRRALELAGARGAGEVGRRYRQCRMVSGGPPCPVGRNHQAVVEGIRHFVGPACCQPACPRLRLPISLFLPARVTAVDHHRRLK